MKVKELVKIGKETMKLLHERGISMDYYQHLPMVQEFDVMKDMGHKTTYIIAHLSEKYDICERKDIIILKHRNYMKNGRVERCNFVAGLG